MLVCWFQFMFAFVEKRRNFREKWIRSVCNNYRSTTGCSADCVGKKFGGEAVVEEKKRADEQHQEKNIKCRLAAMERVSIEERHMAEERRLIEKRVDMMIDGLRRERNLEDRLASVERDLMDEVRRGGQRDTGIDRIQNRQANRYGDVTTWVQSVVTGVVIEILKLIGQWMKART